MSTKTPRSRNTISRKAPVIVPSKLSLDEKLAVLRSMREGEEEDLAEQRQTGALLMKALEDRRARVARSVE